MVARHGRLAGAVLLFLLATMSTALAASSVPIPLGFRFLCTEHPSECEGGGESRVSLDDKLMKLLERVNRQVNAAIVPDANDPYDMWRIGATRGDCEEYVLAKRRALIRSGIPASALSIVYVRRKGEGHAILAVHTDGGSFALDNLSQRVKPLSKTGYRIVSMSGPDPKVWTRG